MNVAPLPVSGGRGTPAGGCGAGGRPQASHRPLSGSGASQRRPGTGALEPRSRACGGARPGWAGVAAPPRERLAGPSLFEARSHRPVRDCTTSPEAGPAASARAPRRRVSGGGGGAGRGGILLAAATGQGRGRPGGGWGLAGPGVGGGGRPRRGEGSREEPGHRPGQGPVAFGPSRERSLRRRES